MNCELGFRFVPKTAAAQPRKFPLSRKTVIRLDGAAFFRPEEFAVLKEAVERAWRTLSSNGVGDHTGTRLILAKGVIAAARRGERDLNALSLAACRHWVRSSEPKRQQTSVFAVSSAVH